MPKFRRPAAGTLQEIKIAEGATVQINTVVAVITEMGRQRSRASTALQRLQLPATSSRPWHRCSCARIRLRRPARPGTDVPMPQMGESITEGTITKWLKKVGETVERDEPLFEISTDKVDAEIPSPAAGVLTEIKFPEGSTVSDQHGGRGDRRRAREGCARTPASAAKPALHRLPLPQLRLRRRLRARRRSRASACAPRRWCARLPRTTTSI